MRISDWSSDVCSSDLDFRSGQWYRIVIETKADPTNGFARIWVNGKLLLEEKGAIGYADAAEAGYFRFGIYRTTGTLGTTMVKFKNVKIGRASCRERVCQYV